MFSQPDNRAPQPAAAAQARRRGGGTARMLASMLASGLALGLAGPWGLAPAIGAPQKARAAAAVPPELPAETLGTSTLEGVGTQRVYVADVAISHIVDGRLRVFDATSGKLLGMINSGYAGNFALSAKSDEVYIATTYLSRGGRGERTDLLEVWDTTQLGFKYEVLLPTKRAQALNYRGLVRPSGDGRFVMVQNATPATSVTVVDLAARKVATEVPTPGCWGIWPAASGARFSMLCGDGKVATITLDANGQVSDRQLSAVMFDGDRDAWFHHAEQWGDRAWFLSFNGTAHELDLSGPVAQLKSSKRVVGAAQHKAGWRPGGYQAFAVSPSGRQMVLAMHDQGGEGSHKRPARSLWVVDLETGKRLASFPGQGSASLTFSKSGDRLQALDGLTGAMRVWRYTAEPKPALKLLSEVKRAGEASLHLESHD